MKVLKTDSKKIEDHITPNVFLANEMFSHSIDIKVGYSTYIELPENIKKVYKSYSISNGKISCRSGRHHYQRF